jgi:hypothetical protein
MPTARRDLVADDLDYLAAELNALQRPMSAGSAAGSVDRRSANCRLH